MWQHKKQKQQQRLAGVKCPTSVSAISPILILFNQILFTFATTATTSTTTSATSYVSTSNRTTFEIVVMVPFQGDKQVGSEVITAANLALENMMSGDVAATLPYIYAAGIDFKVTVINTKCDTGIGLAEVVRVVRNLSDSGRSVDAFVGPLCDNVCETVGLLAHHWGIPMISFGCEESKLSDRSIYSTFLRTTGTFKSMVIFLEDVLDYYSWDTVMLVSAGSQVWLETEEEFKHELEADQFTVDVWNILADEWDSVLTLFQEKSQKSKIFILCMFGSHVLQFLDIANQAGMMDGTHSFIAFDYANMGKRTHHKLDGDHLTGLLDITLDVRPESRVFDAFVHNLTQIGTIEDSRTNFLQDGCNHYEYGIHAGLLYDAVKLYIHAVEATLSDGSNPRDGKAIAEHVYNVTLEGVTGKFHINQYGHRDASFMLHNVGEDGCYVQLLHTKASGHGVEPVSNNSPIWPGGYTDIPLGHPPCGWDGGLCEEDDVAVVAGIAVSLLVVFLAISIGVFLYLRMLRKRHENSRRWIIGIDDLHLKETSLKSRTFSSSGLMNGGSGSRYSSNFSEASETQVFARQYFYLGEEVAGKEVHLNMRHFTQGLDKMSKEINTLRDLIHPNICHFYGVCVTLGHQMSVWEYCRKGSLLDVLHNYQNYLEDIPFKVSFMNDITRGLKYLHNSNRGYHGSLKSANVLVDNKWTCKLAHMTITCLDRPPDSIEAGDKTNYGRLLPCAPEVLRDPNNAIESQASDVYSFGIVLNEIFTGKEINESFSAAYTTEQTYTICHRKSKKRLQKVGPDPTVYSDPYPLCEDVDPKDIVSRLAKGGTIPFRPVIPETIDPMVRTILMECWREQPNERPSIESLAGLIKRVSNKYSNKSKSLIEQMLDKVTREADMQAQELKEEKNKSDNLLYQMLPSTVADCLKRQIEVKAETFQSASVYFSDIQGFTELSSVSEPIEIVNFLNDIYYRFDSIIEKYGVYKVETIGDAYVVCSGAPIRCVNHASEISKMALHILMETQNLQVLHRPEQSLCMRIGMHSGPVAAGVVGRTMPRYCLFGDTVNTASRMESTGIAGRIQISEQCRHLLDESFTVEEREPVFVKGKGTLQTYFLVEKHGFRPSSSNPCVKIDVTTPSPSPSRLYRIPDGHSPSLS